MPKHTEADMILRPASADDLSSIVALHVANWRDAYAAILDPAFLAGPVEQERLEIWRDRLLSPQGDQRITVAVEGDNLVGFVCTFGNEDPRWGACVDNLHVAPAERGRGIGAILLESAASWVAAQYPGSGLHLWVFEANPRARRFYERLGARAVEKSVTELPCAGSPALLRLHWPKAAELAAQP